MVSQKKRKLAAGVLVCCARVVRGPALLPLSSHAFASSSEETPLAYLAEIQSAVGRSRAVGRLEDFEPPNWVKGAHQALVSSRDKRAPRFSSRACGELSAGPTSPPFLLSFGSGEMRVRFAGRLPAGRGCHGHLCGYGLCTRFAAKQTGERARVEHALGS